MKRHDVTGKEYGKADSRYLTRDACTIGIEAITAFIEGPTCFLLILAFTQRLPWRHILTIIVVVGELYGTVLYFLTSYYEGNSDIRHPSIHLYDHLLCDAQNSSINAKSRSISGSTLSS